MTTVTREMKRMAAEMRPKMAKALAHAAEEV